MNISINTYLFFHLDGFLQCYCNCSIYNYSVWLAVHEVITLSWACSERFKPSSHYDAKLCITYGSEVA